MSAPTDSGRSLTVSECFGPTCQGEGPSTGQRCAFLRLGGCNLDCSWCDTPYTWDWSGKNGTIFYRQEQTRRVSVLNAATLMQAYKVPLIVVTGGEPLTQRPALAELLLRLTAGGLRVEVETNGTLMPIAGADVRWNVSPKLASSGVARAQAINLVALRSFAAADSVFKFVACSTDDLDDIGDVVTAAAVPDDRVWVMPEGRTAQAITAGLGAIAQPVIDRGWNVSSRLHVLAWGDERAR